MSKFPVPVSGEKIPHGWFANLVRFVNSLTLRGDGRYTMVSRNESGTTVTLTPAVKNAIERSGGTPPDSGGGADGIEADVTGGTASITLTGGTGSVNITGTGAVTITKNTNTGDIEINATGGTASGYPAWESLVPETIYPSWDSANEVMDPEILSASGYLYIQFYPSFTLNDTDRNKNVRLYVFVDGKEVFGYQRQMALSPLVTGDTVSVILTDDQERSDMISVCSGSTVTASYQDSSNGTPDLVFTLYKDTSA